VSKASFPAASVVLVLGLLGCGRLPAYQRVDLSRDLTPDDVRRYEREHEDAKTTGHGGASMLEHTNWWPLGILVYWRRGSVMRTATPSGAPLYLVSSAVGVGPIAHLYVGETTTTYDATGKRLSSMSTDAVSHLSMTHRSEAILPNGTHQKMTSWHFLHHLINIHKMDGHTNVSLISGPSPIGLDFHGESCH